MPIATINPCTGRTVEKPKVAVGMTTRTCARCAHASRRYTSRGAYVWCQRYREARGTEATACLDYISRTADLAGGLLLAARPLPAKASA